MFLIHRRLFCAVLFIISGLTALSLPGPARAQDDPCTRDAVIASFAAAASSGTVDEWLQGYQGGGCALVIKGSAQELADIYTTLGSAGQGTVASTDIRYGGDVPVIHVTNALGIEDEIAVSSLQPIPDGLSSTCYYYSNCVVLETAPGSYFGIWLSRVRTITYDAAAQHYVAVIDTGMQFTGQLTSVLATDVNGNSFDLTGADQITLYSLPEPQPESEEPMTNAIWTLEMTSPVAATYVGIPFFTYVYYSSAGYLIGGEDHSTSSQQFQINLQGRFVSAEIDDFQGIALTGSDTIEITKADGQKVSGAIQFVANDSAGDHIAYTWGIALALDKGLYLSFPSNSVATLTKN